RDRERSHERSCRTADAPAAPAWSRSWLSHADGVEESPAHRAASRASFGYRSARRVTTIDQRLVADRKRAGIVEFVSQDLAAGGTDRTIVAQARAPIAEMQASP